MNSEQVSMLWAVISELSDTHQIELLTDMFGEGVETAPVELTPVSATTGVTIPKEATPYWPDP